MERTPGAPAPDYGVEDARTRILDDLLDCVALLNTAIAELDGAPENSDEQSARKLFLLTRTRAFDAVARISADNRSRRWRAAVTFLGVVVPSTGILIGAFGLWAVPVSLAAWVVAANWARVTCVYFDCDRSIDGRGQLAELKERKAPDVPREHHPAREALRLLDRVRLRVGVYRRIGNLTVFRAENRAPTTVVELCHFAHDHLCRGLHCLEHPEPRSKRRKTYPDERLSWRDSVRFVAWFWAVRGYLREFFAATAAARTWDPAMLNAVSCMHLASLWSSLGLWPKKSTAVVLRIDRWSLGWALTVGARYVKGKRFVSRSERWTAGLAWSIGLVVWGYTLFALSAVVQSWIAAVVAVVGGELAVLLVDHLRVERQHRRIREFYPRTVDGIRAALDDPGLRLDLCLDVLSRRDAFFDALAAEIADSGIDPRWRDVAVHNLFRVKWHVDLAAADLEALRRDEA